MSSLLNKLRSLEAEVPRQPSGPAAMQEPYFRRDTFPLSLFGNFGDAAPALLEKIYDAPFPKQLKKEQLLFLDTETTGLAGGAGTVAFQIGIGYFEKNGFTVEQYLIHHYGQEERMLAALGRKMERYPVLVTFNGRSFDVPLLRSRFTMCCLSQSGIPAIHADVLYPARRLWKLRLKSCALGNLEEKLLGVTRDNDLPGALVPQAYFRYQQDGDFAPMLRILDHNRQDIVSLAQLFFYVCSFVAHPERVQQDTDLYALSKEYKREGQAGEERKCYRLLSRGSYRPQAFQAMAEAEKRNRRPEIARRLYLAMLSRGECPVEACIALAKLEEHQFRRPEEALAYTRRALMLLAEPGLSQNERLEAQRAALRIRYERLIKSKNRH